MLVETTLAQYTVAVRQRERVESMFFEGLKIHENDENKPGIICIPGDLGDVLADSAEQTEGGVVLHGVELKTSIDFDEEEKIYAIETVVYSCYESIGEDTFTPTRRK